MESKVALITGAGSGIGKATALAFLADGFRVVLAGRHREGLEEVAHSAAAAQSLVHEVDVTDPAQVRALFEAAREKFGRLDVLFNNAGRARRSASTSRISASTNGARSSTPISPARFSALSRHSAS
jgi:NAD(P)-dependent dehydrogenase (short-subunit alcohol dehydrogenase family)